ncbi:hypothetical protein AYI69_g1426 [Smittium culicis]|uniref:Uncharacterized protein n=1 Tax=Smittium culicis TaxID=133412 RepID=A0A1R1YQA7_9FUNG|nr:hypothetical protein AYI69_g1426 [Smittium culicis]
MSQNEISEPFKAARDLIMAFLASGSLSGIIVEPFKPVEFKDHLESIGGTKIDDFTVSLLEPEYKETITKWKNVYGLKARKETSSKTITIHRVASVYPEEVAEILKKHGSKCRILNFEGVTIPTYLRFNSAPAILLDEHEFNEWLKWAVEFDKLINKTKHDKYAVIKFGLKAYEG